MIDSTSVLFGLDDEFVPSTSSSSQDRRRGHADGKRLVGGLDAVAVAAEQPRTDEALDHRLVLLVGGHRPSQSRVPTGSPESLGTTRRSIRSRSMSCWRPVIPLNTVSADWDTASWMPPVAV